MTKVVIGDPASPLAVYNAGAIKSCSCVMYSALSGEELAIDQLLPVIYSAAYVHVRFIPSGSTGLRTADGYRLMCLPDVVRPDKIPYGTPVRLYEGDALVGKFYFVQAVRTAKTFFSLTAVSGVGILDGQTHYGGIYTGQSFQTVAGEIIGGAFPFTCAPDVQDIPVFNWLPIASRRANLHQLLFANGVILRKDAAGEVYFQFPDTDTVKNVPDNRIFYGGDVDYLTPATGANVTEHTYIPLESDEQVTLYDNTQSGEVAADVFVSFRDAPIHDLQVTGSLTISESGVNYAIVSGLGTLVGKKYTHITRVISKTVQGRAVGAERIATVENATLVSAANSRNVLERVLSYYASARRIRSDIVLADEKPGDLIAMSSPYNEPENAFLAQMDITSGSFLRAACELITGYVPSGGGNNYTASVVLTGEGEWVSPIDGRVKFAVIGAGSGATGGNCGGAADGYHLDFDNFGDDSGTYRVNHIKTDGSIELYQDKTQSPGQFAFLPCPGGMSPGVGGTPGAPGDGGKIFVIETTVTKGQRFPYRCGVGGVGGIGQRMVGSLGEGFEGINAGFTIEPSEAGTEGTDTVFGPYNSADGVRLRYGYLDVLTNTLYGSVGDGGYTGQSGYLGSATVDGVGQGPNPGQPGAGEWERDNGDGFPDSNKAFRLGGSGTGGPAYGTAGTTPPAIPEYVNSYGRPDAGAFGLAEGGVKGAKPVKPPVPAAYGKGGQAGHGGGGGSCAGAGESQIFGNWGGYKFYRPGGVGGDGSDGGDGAPGCIVILM